MHTQFLRKTFEKSSYLTTSYEIIMSWNSRAISNDVIIVIFTNKHFLILFWHHQQTVTKVFIQDTAVGHFCTACMWHNFELFLALLGEPGPLKLGRSFTLKRKEDNLHRVFFFSQANIFLCSELIHLKQYFIDFWWCVTQIGFMIGN